jgi:hydrogenase/urease accessory protein HupE
MICARLLVLPTIRAASLVIAASIISFFQVPVSQAHEVRPTYLELTETTAGAFDVLFKTPMVGDMRLSLHAAFSPDVEIVTPTMSRLGDDAMIQTWRIRPKGDFEGVQIRVIGLENTISDALVRVDFQSGRSWSQRLTPSSPFARVPPALVGSGVALTYFLLGVEHILFGFDHLLFVLGLILITTGLRPLVQAITAFTLAHSITLAAAALGFVHVPSKPVEAVIALSIIFVALQALAISGEGGSAVRKPWLIAFAFGLLHGFGFAGALSEIGMPKSHIPIALLFFNLGVEGGQLLFVGAVIVSMAGFHFVWVKPPRWAALVPAYLMGSVATFWMFQRIALF